MSEEATQTTVHLTVNGRPLTVETDHRWLLLDLVRDGCDLKGTHVGCLTGDCGACTVRMNGAVVKSCLELAVAADGAALETIESLETEGELSDVQQSFWDEYGFQCGYCLPGMLFAVEDLLERTSDPDEATIRHAIDGNLCRCTGYHGIVRAVRAAAARRRGE